ncbi:hypothetical protein P43SY_000737 [Pythium insidiosum]|uniref:Uncharacterized protein n=1 Tax=Pythium insidiosum TaxID=114742 RepID=A0AAD5LSD3_PYTIN|nr:hypothetical protein P43SY_000737 [Pythium insidiosum]
MIEFSITQREAQQTEGANTAHHIDLGAEFDAFPRFVDAGVEEEEDDDGDDKDDDDDDDEDGGVIDIESDDDDDDADDDDNEDEAVWNDCEWESDLLRAFRILRAADTTATATVTVTSVTV